MKLAYLTSLYPSVSHTFVQREIAGLRARGVEIGTFSVRRPPPAHVLGPEAHAELARTRCLVPVPWAQIARAFGWALLTRPGRLYQTLAHTLSQPVGLRQRFTWLCYFAEAVLLAYWLIRGGFAHLHCHFGNNGASTGMLAAELAGIPFSFTVHGSELREPGRLRLAHKVSRAAFVACVSWYGRAQLMLLCPPALWSRLHVIRCGPPPVRPQPAARPAGDPPRILCVGRLSPEKGHWVLLDALAELRRRGSPARCLLIGDGPLRAELAARAAQLNLVERVTFAGALAADDVLALYATADVVVLASFSEGVPVVLMEALAFGRPVVATSVGGVPELVRHGETGRLVAPGNPAELADALQWLLAHPAEAAALGARGARWVRDEFALDQSVDRLLTLFRRTAECTPACATNRQPAPA